MALQTSGQISLNDLHVEAGGTSGTQASMNDSDIRGLLSAAANSQMTFSGFYGASSSYLSATMTAGSYSSPSSQYSSSQYSTGYHNTQYGNPTNSYGSITTDNAGSFQAGAKIAWITNNQSLYSVSFVIDDNADVPNSGWTTLQIGNQSFSRTAASYSTVAANATIGAPGSQGRRSMWTWSYPYANPPTHPIPNSGTISVLVT
jgi:hypothetical protein